MSCRLNIRTLVFLNPAESEVCLCISCALCLFIPTLFHRTPRSLLTVQFTNDRGSAKVIYEETIAGIIREHVYKWSIGFFQPLIVSARVSPNYASPSRNTGGQITLTASVWAFTLWRILETGASLKNSSSEACPVRWHLSWHSCTAKNYDFFFLIYLIKDYRSKVTWDENKLRGGSRCPHLMKTAVRVTWSELRTQPHVPRLSGWFRH